MNPKISSGLALCACLSSQVQAGGLWLNEFGDPSGGRGSAGAVAGVDDASTILHNPAGMTRLKGGNLLLSVGYAAPDIKFDLESSTPELGDNDGGNAGAGVPTGTSFYVNDLNSERWSAGISMAALSGAGLDYNKKWAGRYQVQNTALVIIALAPGVAYKLTDKLSLGATAQLWYGALKMDVAIPNPLPPGNRPDGQAAIDGDDFDVGFTVGLMYELSPQTRFGINYQSEIETSHDSDLEISPIGLDLKAELNIPLAQLLRFGFHHDLNDTWGLDFTGGWDDWSTFDHVLINLDSGLGGSINQGWKDTWHIAGGFQYHYSPATTLAAGISYDTSPQTDGRRTPDLPVDEQLRYSVGFIHDVRNDFTVGAYLNYVDLGDGRIENPGYTGEFGSNSLLQVSMNFSWKFD